MYVCAGVVFATMAVLENTAMMFGSMACNGIYEATVAHFPGLTYLINSGIMTVGLVLLM